MHIHHLYVDDHGSSRIGRVPVAMSPFVDHGERTPTIDVEQAYLMSTVPPFASPLHASSRSQLMVVLRGRFRFVTTTDDTVELGPGDILFADDPSGSGHTTALVSEEPEGRLLIVPVIDPAALTEVLQIDHREPVPSDPPPTA